MKQRKNNKNDRPERSGVYDEPLPTISNTEWTGLMPTPPETEAENLAYGEIETLQTDETLRADVFHDEPTGK